jgi:hypothetical protein
VGEDTGREEGGVGSMKPAAEFAAGFESDR